MRAKSHLEEELLMQIKLEGLPMPEREFLFHPLRKWRFDFSWPNLVACEVEGGIWIAGRHNRPASFEKDAEKYCEAVVRGWRVLRVTSKQIKNGQAVGWLKILLTPRRRGKGGK